MNLEKLRYFYDSARLGSVTEAAKANFVTQSAVSQAIRSLEDELGNKLIQHKRNSFELTDFGRIAFAQSEAVFGAVENLRANLSLASDLVTGPLTIATTNSIALTLLAPALKSISAKHPSLVISLKLGNSDQVKEYLRTREADIGFLLEDDEMEEFDSSVLKEGRFLIVDSSRKKTNDAPEKILITRRSKIEIKHLHDLYRKKLKKEFRIHMEVFSWELIRQLCLNGTGAGYVPDYLIEEDLKEKRLKALLPELKTWRYKLLAVRLKGRTLSRNASELLKTMAI